MAPKQLSGYEKRKRKRLDEEMKKSQAGALEKYLDKPTLERHEHAQVNLEEIEGQEHIDKQEAKKDKHIETNINEEDVIHNIVDIFDPRSWERLNSDEIKLLVEKSPKRDNNIASGPYTINRRKGQSRGCLPRKGYKNWLHAPEKLRIHEITTVHLENMSKWYDMSKRLKFNETIDKVQYEQLCK
ncbi:uncharacterized protein [Rutidosis leptorrhynchoides]|uniref:uncharacterized protein n=1 Tax=Rutidosis leptorrhynchoides TaxID=125765 RepID=UPI003A99965C